MSKPALLIIVINVSLLFSGYLGAMEIDERRAGGVYNEKREIQEIEKRKILNSMNCDLSEVYFSEIFGSFFPISDSYYFSTRYSGRWTSYFKRPVIGFLGGGYILFGKVDKVEKTVILPSEKLIEEKINESKYKDLHVSRWKLRTGSTYTLIQSEKEFIVIFDPIEDLWKVSLDAFFSLKGSLCIKENVERRQESEP